MVLIGYAADAESNSEGCHGSTGGTGTVEFVRCPSLAFLNATLRLETEGLCREMRGMEVDEREEVIFNWEQTRVKATRVHIHTGYVPEK